LGSVEGETEVEYLNVVEKTDIGAVGGSGSDTTLHSSTNKHVVSN